MNVIAISGSITSTSFDLSWDPPPYESQNGEVILYVINVTVLETGEQLQWTATNTTLEVTGLKPFRTYACRLAASTSVGLGPFGPEVAFQTLEDSEFSLFLHHFDYLYIILNAEPSGSPINVTFVVVSPTDVVLTWGPPSYEKQNGKIVQYIVEVVNNQTGELQRFSTPDNSLNILLQPYRTYMLLVAAATEIGLGPFSNPETVVTPEGCKFQAQTSYSVVNSSFCRP